MSIYQDDQRPGQDKLKVWDVVGITTEEWDTLRPDLARPTLPTGVAMVFYDSETGIVTAWDANSYNVSSEGFSKQKADAILQDEDLEDDVIAHRESLNEG